MVMKKTPAKQKTAKKVSQSTQKQTKAKKNTKTKKATVKKVPASRVQGTIKRSLSKKEPDMREIELAFYAPLARLVQVSGSFNAWNGGASTLKRDTDGTWRGKLSLKPGRYEYRYLIDGNWENAQCEHEMVENGMGGLNSVLTVS
jgi:1,4-alpha-glucan branching enzyme